MLTGNHRIRVATDNEACSISLRSGSAGHIIVESEFKPVVGTCYYITRSTHSKMSSAEKALKKLNGGK